MVDRADTVDSVVLVDGVFTNPVVAQETDAPLMFEGFESKALFAPQRRLEGTQRSDSTQSGVVTRSTPSHRTNPASVYGAKPRRSGMFLGTEDDWCSKPYTEFEKAQCKQVYLLTHGREPTLDELYAHLESFRWSEALKGWLKGVAGWGGQSRQQAVTYGRHAKEQGLLG